MSTAETQTEDGTTQQAFGTYDETQTQAAETFVTQLARAVLNEKLAPEILFYQAECLEESRAAVNAQTEAVDALEQSEGAQLERLILQADTQRIQYMMRSYHRARLDKLMQWSASILDSSELQARLSPQEMTFVQSFFVAGGKLLKNVLLDNLPTGFRSLVKSSDVSSEKDLIPKPEVECHVVARALEDCGHVVVDSEGLTVDLARGEAIVIKYSAVAQLLHDGKVELV